MQKRLLVLVVLFAIFSCKKSVKDSPKTTPVPTRDSTLRAFTFIPMDSVTWHVHCQGQMVGDSNGYHWDSTLHNYTTVTATGQTFYRASLTYHTFRAVTLTTTGSTTGRIDTSWVYVGEDTLNKKVSGYYMNNNYYSMGYLILDCTLNVSDVTQEFFRWPSGCTVNTIDSIPINGQYCKRWNTITTSGSTFFYQSYGIGWQMGILTFDFPFCGNGGEVRSLEFIYKSDSIHIDFPYY